MIFLLDQRDPGTVLDWLASGRGRALADRVRVVTYQELLRRPRLAAETCFFGDLETLPPALKRVAAAAWDALGAAGVRRLNDPRRVPGRHELLRRLSELGRNRFRAYRLDELPAALRYPVFLRRERAHDGALTELLHDPEALRRALSAVAWPRSRHRRDDLLVVEYCDASVGGGLFLRLSALRIGDAIIPRYYTVASHWMVKTNHRVVDEAIAAREHEYVTTNPDRDWISESFDVAGVEYGRLDYGVVEGERQVWEINTNPSLGRRVREAATARIIPPAARALQEPSLLLSHHATREALLALDAESRPGEVLPLRIAPALRCRYYAEWVRTAVDKAWRASTVATFGAIARRRALEPIA